MHVCGLVLPWAKQSLLHKQWVTLRNMQTDCLYHSELTECKLDYRTIESKLEIKLESLKFLKACEVNSY